MHETDKSATVHLVKWLLTSADIWYLVYKCADYVSKAQGPAQNSLAVLDTIFTVEEEEDLNSAVPLNGVGEARVLQVAGGDQPHHVENRQQPPTAGALWWRRKFCEYTYLECTPSKT